MYLDGEFMTYLDREEALKNFELFLSSGLLSKISDATHHGGTGVGYPLWLKLQDALLMLDELRQERHNLAGASADFYDSGSYGDDAYYLGAVSTAGASSEDDATLLGQTVSMRSALVDDEEETSTSLSPSSSVPETSQSLGTPPKYLYDDTVGEILRERAIEYGKMPASSVVELVHVATAEQAEPLLPPSFPSSLSSGHAASDEPKRETKKQQAAEAGGGGREAAEGRGGTAAAG